MFLGDARDDNRVEPTKGDVRAAGPSPWFTVAEADAIEGMRALPSASIDLILTDPPYESLEKHRAIGTTTRLKRSKASSNDWFKIFPNRRFLEFFAEAYRVLNKNSHLYLMCDAETMFVTKPLGEAAGFKFWKPLVWDKVNIGMGYHYRARYEFVLFFEKGKRKLSNLALSDVIQVPRVHNGYPAEKPVKLAAVLVAQSTLPGEIVLDPFVGSGSTGVAAVDLGRNFHGIDICTEAVDATRQRLANIGGKEKALITNGATQRQVVTHRDANAPSKHIVGAEDHFPVAR
jgi:site-specific DNA-methyltransferase (adenine-specific)